MNNKELQELFQSLMLENDNIFDVYINLKESISSYKETSFYKATKFTIYEAFDLYMRGIGGVDYVLGLFKNIDSNKYFNIINKLSESLNLDGIVDVLSQDNKELFLKSLEYLPYK